MIIYDEDYGRFNILAYEDGSVDILDKDGDLVDGDFACIASAQLAIDEGLYD